MIIFFVILGLCLLYFGAEGLVKGASSLSYRLSIQPLTIGLTVVAFGTSAPELFTCAKAALKQMGGISVGNALGSNIFNIAIIVGIAALIYPLNIQIRLIRQDVPLMIGVTMLFVLFFRDQQLLRMEGLLMTIGIFAYTGFNFYQAQKARPELKAVHVDQSLPNPSKNIGYDLLFIIGGLGLLTYGSSLLIDNSIELARILGISEATIGLTIISAGTSLPELATSIVAAMKKEPEIAIGNVVGSNIFNILCVLGISSLIMPIHGTGISLVDVVVLVGVSTLLLPIMWTDQRISRREGLVLIVIYLCYLAYLIYTSI
jgi:cation:H+ antiporter